MTKVLKTKPLGDPVLSEFVYTIAMTASVSQKRHLPLKFFKAIRTERGAKKFSLTASVDQKKEFLEYMGYKSFWIISNVDNVWNTAYKETLKKFEKPGGKVDWEQIVNEGLFVTSDKQLIQSFTTVAQAMASPLYRMEQELYRAVNDKNKWSPKLEVQAKDLVYEENKKSERLIKFSDSVIKEFFNCERFLEIGSAELLALGLCYTNRNSYVSHEQIKEHLTGFVAFNRITKVERNLLEKLMIQQNYDYTKKEFTITARGILTMNKFRDQVLKSSNF